MDPIQPALRAKLSGARSGSHAVAIQFNQLPSADELRRMGLDFEGDTAWGRLSAEQILALAKFPQVRSIDLSDRPGPAPRRQAVGPKIKLSLESAMRNTAETHFHVVVKFRTPMGSPPEVTGLTVFENTAFGMASREDIERLAQSEDVVSIDTEPPSMPAQTERRTGGP